MDERAKELILDILRDLTHTVDSMESRMDRAEGRDDSYVGYNAEMVRLRNKIDELEEEL